MYIHVGMLAIFLDIAASVQHLIDEQHSTNVSILPHGGNVMSRCSRWVSVPAGLPPLRASHPLTRQLEDGRTDVNLLLYCGDLMTQWKH